jgi:class 3 adenylate cyclase
VVHVVPVAFAALDLPAGVDPDDLAEELCLEVARSWAQGRETVSEELIARASTRDAHFLFRLLSTVGELDLIRSFAQLLGSQLADGVISVASERPMLARLYGPTVGELLADCSDAAVAAAFNDGASQTFASVQPTGEGTHPLLTLDTSVVAATREVANYLKARFVAERNRADFDPLRRVGLSLVELGRSVPPEGIDALMLSRCIDYGLARTTLVPFTDVELRESGEVRVRRKYRVAEASRSDQDYEDVETMRREEGEELIALTAATLAKRTDLWPDGLVPYEVVACALALLRAVLPGINGSPTIVYSPLGPRLMLGEPANLKSVYSLRSTHFRLEGEDLAPTGDFLEAHRARRLALDRRHAGTVEIESYLKTIAAILSTADDPPGELLSWALAAQPKMGLDVVDHHIRRATEHMIEPLTEILRGDAIGRPKLALVIKDARELLDAANETISRLEDDRMRRRTQGAWPSPDRAEGELQLLASAPTDPPDLLQLARQSCASLKVAAEQLLNLARSEDPDAPDESSQAALETLEAMVAEEFRLTNVLRSAPASADGDAMCLAAAAIKRVIEAARSRSSAVAGIYRGVPRPTGSSRGLPSPRHATVMVADLAGSTATSMRLAHDAAVGWGNEGLALVDQWARAFGGIQVGAREGDAIRVEFADADAALLCAAVVQRHVLALRSTGRAGWRCRVAIDTGEISDSDSYNTLGRPINVASKLVKFCPEHDDAFDRVLLTPAAAQELCARLREGLLAEMPDVFEIAPDYAAEVTDTGASFRPLRVDSAAAVAVLLSEPEVAPL